MQAPFLFTPFSCNAILRPMMPLRPMTEADLDAVLAIEQACFPRAWTRQHFLNELASPYASVMVAEQNGLLAGYLCMNVLLDEAEILDVAVDPALQRSGIGATLLSWACVEARQRGARLLRLEVRATSAPAIALYERFGFVRSGVRKAYYENGTDAVLMDLNLAEEEL